MFAPVELSAVNDDAANGGSMPSYPLGGGMHDYVCAVLDRPDEIASSSEGVVNLARSDWTLITQIVLGHSSANSR